MSLGVFIAGFLRAVKQDERWTICAYMKLVVYTRKQSSRELLQPKLSLLKMII